MSTQGEFVSFQVSKTPEERRAYVEQQIALGNPKYKDRKTWIQENQATIRVGVLEKRVETLEALLKAKTDKLVK
tara:strand:+ start:140 stop:361 length:222 start_codon:yes stop_codon:yes gene_type:complete